MAGAGSDTGDEVLAQAAVAALQRAYSPYSKVCIGAALEAEDGQVFTGCNVENASYGLTICAERTALFTAVAAGVRSFRTIVVATDRDEAWMPCGACRQTLLEFAPELRVLVQGRDGVRKETTLARLLPEAFDPSQLRSS